MICRLFAARAFASLIVVCVFLLETAPAQRAGGTAPGTRMPSPNKPYPRGPVYPGGPGLGWGYPGLGGGPWIGWPYASGRYGSFWTNGLSLYGPPIPTYGPIPGVFGNYDMQRTWKDYLMPGFGWFGIYAASPRPKPPTVDVWPAPFEPTFEPVPVLPLDTAAPANGGSLILSIKVPQPTAEVFVDGVKTNQSGTDRVFESPPLDGGKEYKYEMTARWIEGGVLVERKKIASGKPGDVVRLDFSLPD